MSRPAPAPAPFTPAPGLSPTLPGLVEGIISATSGAGPRGSTLYTVQCQGCAATETPFSLVVCRILFHPRSPREDNPRLCAECRAARYPDCTCYPCHENRETLARAARAAT